MTAAELTELKQTLEKANEHCALLEELKKVEYLPVDVTASLHGRTPIKSELARKIFESGIAAVRKQTESALEQLQINRPKDSPEREGHPEPSGVFTGIIPKGREIL